MGSTASRDGRLHLHFLRPITAKRNEQPMSIHAALHHVTRYRYDRPVQLGPQVVRLRPAPHCRSNVISYSLRVEPAAHFLNWQQDPFANYQARLVFEGTTTEFTVTVDLVVEMAVYNPFDFFIAPSAEEFPFDYGPALAQDLAPYLATEPLSPLLAAYLEKINRDKQPTIDFLVGINQQVASDVKYLLRMEPGVQTPEHTLRAGCGSCRDSGWLLVQLMRRCGLAARFVSGYLIQLAPDVKALDGPSGTDTDFTDLHAWCEVYLPGAGWIGLDATSGLLAGEGHIPLACTPAPSSAAPIEGGVEKAEVEFGHEMHVSRLFESPRVTRPYTEGQWADVLALGTVVDAALEAGDVRLTMGSKPTFVAVADRDAPEWNTEALGPTKRCLATELVERLSVEYGKGGFLHRGQGRWYPGEPSPRWALSIFWRADGEPVWHDPDLIADERSPRHYDSEDARRFIELLSAKLSLNASAVMPAYEDAEYYRWRERRLPANVDSFDSKPDGSPERSRSRYVLGHQLDAVVGYALPLKVDPDSPVPTFGTGDWLLGNERLYLVPGDLPMGCRLSLDSLPWASEADRLDMIDQDSNVRRITRGALCVEARDPRSAGGPLGETSGEDGRVLYVFMPAVSRLDDYLQLIAAVEATARELQVRIVLEGSPPPRDPRLNMLQVTPEVGVIEVNLHCAKNWPEVVAHTGFLYQAAFETRLSAEKFMTDGRHTGTGGGNHLAMGGATPADSPFLRQPDLLASLLTCWHNHPCLSYLFSGPFIGPDSSAPRVDEASRDQPYELEIALREIHRSREKTGDAMPPEMLDRALRHILTDAAGNTHRSEFGIDKLCSPDSATGRLGLLELRAFGMPPHERMSIVQQLLLRALIARFWNEALRTPLTRWGTALHDRFLLPTFLRMDFDDVIADLRDAGYAFDASWFAPHFEFRFPLVGSLAAKGIALELRHALEPWHLMTEEAPAGGTVRCVDSSLERMEVRVSGLNQSRYLITVNGRPLPLQPTGTSGEFACGVRFKARNPPSSLHPTVGPHVPLTFDVVDTWNRRSIAGCQYHVTHPGGGNYGGVPVNAYEAESRRMARFSRLGHTPGLMNHPPPSSSLAGRREFPFTLDLR